MKRQEKLVNIFALLVIGIAVAFTIARLFFGAELTDEAYSVAETYMVSNGALPFVNNWSQMPGWPLLLAPFIKLYTLMAGGTDGIFLFFRFLVFTINVITAFTVAYILKDYVKNKILLILLSMIYVVGQISAIRGDGLSLNILAAGGLLLAISFMEKNCKAWHFFVSGMLLALSVFSHPMVIVVFIYFIFAIIFLCFVRKNGYKPFAWFVLGAVAVAIAIIAYLAINSSILEIISGIKYLLKDVTYFQLPNDGIVKLPGYIKDMVKQILIFMFFSFVCLALIIAVEGIFFRKRFLKSFKIEDDCYTIKKDFIKWVAILSLLMGVCVYHAYQIWIYRTADNPSISIYAGTIEVLVVPFIWGFIKSEKRLCRYLIGLVWIPTYIWVIAMGLGTYNDIIRRHDLLKNAAYLFGLFAVFAIRDNFFADKEIMKSGTRSNGAVVYSFFVESLPVTVMMVVTFTYVFNAYTYVYRDESFWRLDYVIESGPYKGMRTTKVRADGLTELDRIIDEYITGDDYILAMDNDPFIYLMADSKICTPCTWDQALYSYGFDQPDLYYDYFYVTENEPTKIIYFNYGSDEVMSIDVDYKFNDYVNDNFHLIFENRGIFEWSYCNKDIVCELLIYERNEK